MSRFKKDNETPFDPMSPMFLPLAVVSTESKSFKKKCCKKFKKKGKRCKRCPGNMKKAL